MPLFIITALLQTYSCSSQMTASITQDVNTSTMSTRSILYIVSDSQNYTTGGLTFTYPTGLFTLPPIVNISVQPNAAHPATETFVAEISSHSAGSTTVMVYQIIYGIIHEAPNGSVTINLLALADPA